MRLRNVKGSREIIQNDNFVIHNPTEYKGRFNSLFGNNNPIFIEIGMGKGQFITSLAENNKNINYIGIEKYSSVLVRAIEKQRELQLPNLKFIRLDATDISDVFDIAEISRIYLNFSDPWPKDRHSKRRLTSRQFFSLYEKILSNDGQIEFKTDNVALFDFSLSEIAYTNFETISVSHDLHNDGSFPDNIMTEYEERFSKQGNPIKRAVFIPKY